MRLATSLPLAFAPLALLVAAACSTLATPGGGAENLPTSGVGPFQALDQMQVAPQDIAPFVFTRAGVGVTEPSILAESADGSSPAVTLYAVVPGKTGSTIVRTRADDGRTFYGDAPDQVTFPSHKPPQVLAASLPWEGADVTGPSVLRVGAEIWLYYAAAGGIGLARSPDGATFTKTGAPVLATDATVGWEQGPPRAPTVARFPDGSWHMLYAAGGAIGEATSADGLSWKRADGDPSTPRIDPILTASKAVDPSTLPAGEHPPFDENGVGDPLLLPRVDATGQLQVRVLYTGYGPFPDASVPEGKIGFAARYGDSGKLSRQVIPVYAAPGAPASAPALLEWNGPTMLYVTQLDTVDMPARDGIAVAFDPGAGVPGALSSAYPTAP